MDSKDCARPALAPADLNPIDDVGRYIGRRGGDSVCIGIDAHDGAVLVSTQNGKLSAFAAFTESHHPNTHRALLALIAAMKDDNAADPARDFFAPQAAEATTTAGATTSPQA